MAVNRSTPKLLLRLEFGSLIYLLTAVASPRLLKMYYYRYRANIVKGPYIYSRIMIYANGKRPNSWKSLPTSPTVLTVYIVIVDLLILFYLRAHFHLLDYLTSNRMTWLANALLKEREGMVKVSIPTFAYRDWRKPHRSGFLNLGTVKCEVVV
jgi:hypothetical protein